jgi:hypothetical protein
MFFAGGLQIAQQPPTGRVRSGVDDDPAMR